MEGHKASERMAQNSRQEEKHSTTARRQYKYTKYPLEATSGSSKRARPLEETLIGYHSCVSRIICLL